jgi:hypothetical protein
MKTGAECLTIAIGLGPWRLGKDNELNANNADIALGVGKIGVVRRDPEPCVLSGCFFTTTTLSSTSSSSSRSLAATPHRLHKRRQRCLIREPLQLFRR